MLLILLLICINVNIMSYDCLVLDLCDAVIYLSLLLHFSLFVRPHGLRPAVCLVVGCAH